VVRDRVVEADPIRREAGALKATDQSECVLFIAHPGHELLVYSLFAQRRMNVLVLTDGSGGSGEPRIHKTRELVPRLGGEMIEPSGAHTDGRMYEAILGQDVEFFEQFLFQLVEVLERPSVGSLISDAAEHYNPMHDICAALAALAWREVTGRGRTLSRFICPMVAPPGAKDVSEYALERPLLRSKEDDLSAVSHLITDLTSVLAHRQIRTDLEVLAQPDPSEGLLPPLVGEAFYETYGRQQLARRGGGELITYSQHVRPLVSELECRLETRLALRPSGGRFSEPAAP
jgi:hypothetical protein